MTAFTAGKIDLGAGGDSLTLTDTGGNTVTLANGETVLGSAGDDVVVLTTATTAGSIDLSIGDDKLTLGGSANTGSDHECGDDRRFCR